MNARPFTSATFGRDFLASIVVFLVALPLCMGIALASGMPPTAGIITGIVGGIIVGSISGAPLQVSGPAAGLSVLVWQLVDQFGLQMIGVIVLFAGLIQLVAGLCKLGQWFRAVSPAVINGMLAGIGVLILASQFHVMLDYKPIGTGIQNLLGIPTSLMNAFSEGGTHLQALRHRRSDNRDDLRLECARSEELAPVPGAAGGRHRRHRRGGVARLHRHQVRHRAGQHLVGSHSARRRKN